MKRIYFAVIWLFFLGGLGLAEDCPPGKTWDSNACECVCSGSPDCPSGKTWDSSLCDCVCETVGAPCGEGKVFDTNLCECVCESSDSCDSPHYWDTAACDCLCEYDLSPCPSGKVWNSSTCACECETVNSNCGAGRYWDPLMCDCMCEARDCAEGKEQDLETCQCVCTTTNCGPGKIVDPATCDCICVNEETECPPLKEWSDDACACVCQGEYDAPCPFGQFFSTTECKCVCLNIALKDTCELTGKRWNDEICSCECLEKTECDGGKEWDEESCSCKCPPGTVWNSGSESCEPPGGGTTVPPAKPKIKKLWSRQFVASNGNYLPNGTGKLGFSRLIFGETPGEDPDFPDAMVKAEIQNGDGYSFAIALKKGDSYQIMGPASSPDAHGIVTLKVSDNYIATLGWDWGFDGTLGKGPGDFVVVGGHSLPSPSGNSLPANYVSWVDEEKIMWPVGRDAYFVANNDLGVLATGGIFFFHPAREFLQTFRTGNSSYMTGLGANISPSGISIPGKLDHNIGASFNGSNSGEINDYHFPASSALSHMIVGSNTIKKYINQEIDKPENRSLVQSYVWGENEETKDFPFDPLLVSPDKLIAFDEPGDEGIYLAMGTVTAPSTKVIFTVEKGSLKITKIIVKCQLSDLYDWAYVPKYRWDRWAVALQAGYGTLGNGGRVFRHYINLDSERTLWSADLSFK